MIAVLRFEVASGEERSFEAEAREALRILAGLPGWRSGDVGRAVDDPARWALITHWDGVGAYRRAMSAYDVKVRLTQFLSRAVDEPSAYEVLIAEKSPSAPQVP